LKVSLESWKEGWDERHEGHVVEFRDLRHDDRKVRESHEVDESVTGGPNPSVSNREEEPVNVHVGLLCKVEVGRSMRVVTSRLEVRDDLLEEGEGSEETNLFLL
jgi:hypothetical protein